MSIIRQLARGYRPRFRSVRCASCKQRVCVFEYFCPFCGARNPQVESDAFERVAKATLAEVRSRCAEGWTHEIDAVARFTDPALRRWTGKSLFCGICGGQLPSDHES